METFCIQDFRIFRRKFFTPFHDPVTFDVKVHHLVDLIGRIDHMRIPDDQILDGLPV